MATTTLDSPKPPKRFFRSGLVLAAVALCGLATAWLVGLRPFAPKPSEETNTAHHFVTPAKAGVHMDSRWSLPLAPNRGGNDKEGRSARRGDKKGVRHDKAGEQKQSPRPYCLSCLRVFNTVLLRLRERYVEPARFDPRQMVVRALLALERQVGPVLVQEEDKVVRVRVGETQREFALSGLRSVWHASWLLRDVMNFVERNLPVTGRKADAEYALVNGMLSTLDRYSTLLGPDQAREMDVHTKGEFGGLGIVIGPRDGYPTVISPIKGTPADKKDVRAGDRIEEIDGESTVNLHLDEAANRLRGKPGTSVTIDIRRKGVPKLLRKTIVRAVIQIESVEHKLLAGDVGYVQIKAFDGGVTRKVQNAVKDLQRQAKGRGGIKGYVWDLRNDPGGLLSESVRMANQVLDGGLIVITQGAGGTDREEEMARSGAEKTRLPMVVLVNNGSASASEIVAGALKVRDRALIMGGKTFGKGSVQLLSHLFDGSIFKYTIGEYLTPDDRSIHGRGIQPDIELTPVSAHDRESLRLPALSSRSSESRDGAGDDSKITQRKRCLDRQEQPAMRLTYLRRGREPQNESPGKKNSEEEVDDEVEFAREILLAAAGAKRPPQMPWRPFLRDHVAPAVVAKQQQRQEQRLRQQLRKLGINWAGGRDGALQAWVERPLTTLTAGRTVPVRIHVRNTGTAPIWRLRGVSDADVDAFRGLEFAFGKLAPGQQRSWEIPVEIPKSSLSYHDVMRISLRDGSGEELTTLDVPVHVRSRPRSVLASRFFIVPRSRKGDLAERRSTDGRLHEGGWVDLVLRLKNVGKGPCVKPIAQLKDVKDDKGNSRIFVSKGRHVLPALAAGQETTVRFAFQLKKGKDPVELKVHVYDGELGDGWTRALRLPAAGQTPAGDDGWPLEDRYHIPADVTLVGGEDSVLATGDTYELNARVRTEPFLRDIAVFVGDKKQLFRPVGKAGPLDIPIRHTLRLEPGLNWVTFVLRHDDTHVRHRRFAVYNPQSPDR
ncbi:MAG: MXAN_5808 family serine peptidase [Myxococcota bacterium]